jgi:hypothetical protein
MSKFPRFSASFVIGVGNNPYPVPLMRGADGARRYTRITPALGQVPKNNAQPVIKHRCHVLHDRVLGSNHANGSHKFPVQSRTLAGKAGALSGMRNILAWEATDDDVGFSLSKFSDGDVGVTGDVGPVLCKHSAAELVLFAECDGSHPRAFESEGEPADAAEEIKNSHFSDPNI